MAAYLSGQGQRHQLALLRDRATDTGHLTKGSLTKSHLTTGRLTTGRLMGTHDIKADPMRMEYTCNAHGFRIARTGHE